MDHSLTGLLHALRNGDRQAMGRAFELLYDELRALARRHRRRHGADDMLGTTALVHEAYLKLVQADGLDLDGRAHFLGVAARAMRHLLANHARDRRRLKRGGGLHRTSTDLDHLASRLSDHDLATMVAIDDALNELERHDARLARVVECRFFAGLSVPDTARALGTSAATVKRDWAAAQTWLYERLSPGQPS